jgi:hypothetical protein
MEIENREQRAEQRAESREQRTENSERVTESREQRAEQRAESREQKVERNRTRSGGHPFKSDSWDTKFELPIWVMLHYTIENPTRTKTATHYCR